MDAYALLVLAPKEPLGTGWLGGDKVVGRAAVRDLLAKARRLREDERARLTMYLPAGDVTLTWDEIERLSG